LLDPLALVVQEVRLLLMAPLRLALAVVVVVTVIIAAVLRAVLGAVALALGLHQMLLVAQ